MQWRCMSTGGRNLKSYAEIGQECYGRAGRLAVLVPLLIDLLAVCTLLMILAGTGMHRIAPVLGEKEWTAVFTCIMLPLTWIPSMREIGEEARGVENWRPPPPRRARAMGHVACGISSTS